MTRIAALVVVLLTASACARHLQPYGVALQHAADAAHAIKVSIVAASGQVDLELPAERIDPVLSSAPSGASLSTMANPVTASGTWYVRLSAGTSGPVCVTPGWYCNDHAAAPYAIGPLVMGRAWDGPPPKVETGDAAAMWMLPNGSPVVNIAAGGDRIGATENALNVYDKALIDKIDVISNGFFIAWTTFAVGLVAMLISIASDLDKIARKS